MMRNISKKINVVLKVAFCLVVGIIAIFSLTGCDRTAPTISGIESVIEFDCGTKLNLDEYLKEHIKITDETDEGTVNYKLSDLDYKITCDGEAYNGETGDFDTEKFGDYNAELIVKDKSRNKTTYAFTIKLNPLHINKTIEDIVELDCGTLFNVNDFFKENVKIANLAENKVYEIDDFDYTIECDETVYNASSGKLDTSRGGEYKTTFTINSASLDGNKVDLTIKLNPLAIEKGFHVYQTGENDSRYEYFGFCEYKNTSVDNIKVKSIEFSYLDKDGVTIGSNNMPYYSRDYLASGESGYSLENFAQVNSPINGQDEIASVDVNIEFENTTEADSTSLEVGDMEIVNNYPYNESGFAGTAIITNPHNKNADYFTFLSGLYDANGKLLGVMQAMSGNEKIPANAKVKLTTYWLPKQRTIPDQVVSLKGSARVTTFEN